MKSFAKEKVVVGILQEIGYTDSVGGVTLTVIERDADGNVTKARGITVPSGVAGYALECEFVDTDKTAGTHKLYRNIGTTSSCTFDLVGEVGAADITDESLTLADIADNQVLSKLNIYNNTGGTLTAGTLVRVLSYTGTSGITVEKADADAAKPATHFVPAAINNSASGDIYELGTLTGYNTVGRAVGDAIYLDATTAGGLTYTAPSGADQIVQQVGMVVTVGASGSIFLFPGMFGFTKVGTSYLQSQAVNADKLDSGMFLQLGGLLKDGSNLMTGLSIYNNTGGTLTKGTLVRLLGYTSTNGVTVEKADADADKPATHVVIQDINNLASGNIAPFANLGNQNTGGRTIGDPVYLDATTAGAFTFTAPTGVDQITQLVGFVKVVDAAVGEIVFAPGNHDILRYGASFVRDGSLNPAKFRASESLTATADGLTTGLMSGNTSHAVVTSNNATDWITLPASSAALIGKQFTIYVGANGFELVTPSASNATINGTDSDGTNQCDIPANSLSRLTLVNTNTWLLENIGSTGTVAAAITPDND